MWSEWYCEETTEVYYELVEASCSNACFCPAHRHGGLQSSLGTNNLSNAELFNIIRIGPTTTWKL